jgi:hypothetical protein
MKETLSITVKLFVLLWICAALWHALAEPEAFVGPSDLIYGGLWQICCFFELAYDYFCCHPRLVIVAIILSALIYYGIQSYYKWNDSVDSRISALKGAAFDLIRLMELTTDGVAKKWETMSDIMYRFAYQGPASVARAINWSPRHGQAQVQSQVQAQAQAQAQAPSEGPDYTTKGHETGMTLIQRRLDDAATFGGNWGNVRQGVAAFLAIMQYENLSSAHFIMTEHMKKQRDEFEGKKTKNLPNFGELKKFLGLPIKWPEGDEPEKLQKDGISDHDYKLMTEALEKGKGKIEEMLKTITYNPPTPAGKEPIVVEGKILDAMRMYLRNSHAYHAAFED